MSVINRSQVCVNGLSQNSSLAVKRSEDMYDHVMKFTVKVTKGVMAVEKLSFIYVHDMINDTVRIILF